MQVPQFETSAFSRMTDGNLIHETIRFAERLKDHPAFQNLQDHVPGYHRFIYLADLLKKCSDAAQYHDKLKEEERDKVREEILRSITFACQHVVMFATHLNDPSLLNIGLEQKQRAYSRPLHNLPGMPSKLRVKNGTIAGTVIALVNKEAGMGSIELQITEDPHDDSSWRSQEHYYKCRMEVSGLDLVKRYYFRARYHNSVGTGPWSAVVNLVVG